MAKFWVTFKQELTFQREVEAADMREARVRAEHILECDESFGTVSDADTSEITIDNIEPDAPPDRIDPGAQVSASCEGDTIPPWIGSYGQFAADNELQPDEEEAIARAIRETGEYVGGGGASPVWTLKLADRVEA